MDHIVDATGLKCPEPVMLLHAAVRRADDGDVVVMRATDPSTLRDVAKFCEFLGHELMASETLEDQYRFKIRKVV